MKPLEILLTGLFLVLWLTLLAGVIGSFRSGVEAAQGRYREVRRENEPMFYWLRMAANLLGLTVLTVLLFAAVAPRLGLGA